jgi:BirA family transcriptional regulator, biotin operon repressor / biotin---[acetyl-CoA-carboxylase] ligase
VSRLGRPRLHLRSVGSTNERARELAEAGAPHGTAVTAGEQTAGRGRQGRGWSTPPGSAIALSLVIRDPDPLLSLRAGLAVADLAGAAARVKWPNDVLLDGRKVAGVLVEGRPQDCWAVLGIGVNAALDLELLPEELRGVAGTLGLAPRELPRALGELLRALEARLAEPGDATLAALRERDALDGRPLRWEGGAGTGAGIAADGALLVRRADGTLHELAAGEVHLDGA